jgi:hypothetical protein
MSQSSTVRSRTFCCCIPVRFGVFVLTILGMLGGTTLAVLGWYESASLKGNLSKLNEISIYIFSVVYTILAIMSVFGFIGAIRRRRTLVSIFFSMLVAHLTFNIFSGIFMLYNLFHQEGDAAVQHCIQGSGEAPGLSAADCQKGISVIKGIAIGVLLVIWLLEIWGCFITNSYVSQLDDETYAQWPKVGSDVEVNQVAGPRPL